MFEIAPGLWQLPAETRFGTLNSRAYLVEHSEGMDLIYASENERNLAAVNRMGGVGHIYLSHNHELTSGVFQARKQLNSRLVGHVEMQKYMPDGATLDVALDPGPGQILPGGIEAFYTPGHTDNNVCYRVTLADGTRVLFVGDVIYPDHGVWKTLVMERDGGRHAQMQESLRFLASLDADLILPSLFLGDAPALYSPSPFRGLLAA
ncbi:MAG: MBL fold metallo-hydrolase [Halocynthiibacter sp.]